MVRTPRRARDLSDGPADQPARLAAPVVAKRPLMSDVARAAGVSPTTVSLVLNDRPDSGISSDTRARVLAMVEAMGYRPNQQARALALNRSRTIGFLTDEVAATPFGGRAIEGAHDAARRRGSLMLIMSTSSDRNRRELYEAFEVLQERQVEAIVFAVAGTRRAAVPESAKRIPTVLVNCFTAGDQLPCFLPDDEAGGRAATRMLLDAGHRNVAYLAGLPGAWATRARVKGFRAELRRDGIANADIQIMFGDFTAESGYELARKVLRSRSMPTGLFCGNDRMALGAYCAAVERGLRIPQDISIVGYDDQESLADGMHPPLTTVRLPYYEMGLQAVDHLFTSGGISAATRRTYVTCEPVKRASLAAPRID